ncbi:unnamed protein product [Lepeophtheirus salmonis]|uniref:(salmon louse) hypothetical protein n=1 Tax=Lepeophtheirus salmonis TaxID=72036 RepID=A0A7R8CN89_LEPSM|nr:unnamed protein product [Lepeophtheirus salmonis]CAF2873204.1 unnamed protein product [Lepeophtheirus salmonis]
MSRQVFANISLMRKTIAERISKLSEDLTSQLKQRVVCFVAIDENTDITNVAQLAKFNRGVVFSSPFTVKAINLPVDIQLEIIDLQCDADLEGKFNSAGLDTFYQYRIPGYPKLTALAAKIQCMFGTTYLCEQIFLVMNINKLKLRSKITNKHLNDIIKVTASQDIIPDVDALIQAKRCHVSGTITSPE